MHKYTTIYNSKIKNAILLSKVQKEKLHLHSECSGDSKLLPFRAVGLGIYIVHDNIILLLIFLIINLNRQRFNVIELACSRKLFQVIF